MGELTGKVALVTGAGRGIGREIALRLARDGASLVVHYSGSEGGAAGAVATIREADAKAAAHRANIVRSDEVRAMFAEIDRAPGRLDIVVNSAGVSAG